MIKRYSNKEMAQIWTDEARFDAMLQVEILATKAHQKLGIVPIEDYKKIEENATYDVNRIREIEEETKHDVVAFTRAISETLGQEKKWIHYGLTSTDVVDTAQAILIQRANVILEDNLQKLLEVLMQKAVQYKDTPCIGRTHGIHADITSFGLKWALWVEDLKRNISRFQDIRKEIEVGKISGAVGNFANTPSFVQDEVCRELSIVSANISTQVLQRDRHAHYLHVLALIATNLEKIALEVRHLQRTEVREVEEAFSNKQKGSSAMPHKRNPISSENITGAARVMRGYAQTALEDVALWHERDISHSSVERIILPDATILLNYMLKRYTRVLQHLVVYPERMIKNIYATNGVIFSQRILTTLIDKGLSREEAYDLVQPISMKSFQGDLPMKELLFESGVTEHLTADEIEQCFDLDYFLRNVEEIFKRVGIVK